MRRTRMDRLALGSLVCCDSRSARSQRMAWSAARRVGGGLAAVLLILSSYACGDSATESCVPGRTVSCACAGGGAGVQTCTADETYGACVCDSAPDAGGADATDPDGNIAVDASVVDASVVDASVADASLADASVIDASFADAALNDAASNDAGIPSECVAPAAPSCPTKASGGLTVANATDLALLSGVTRVAGDLWIQESDLTSLAGLECLEAIDGFLRIGSNASLTNIDGLSGLRSIGDYVKINNNPNLLNVDGLAGVTTVSGSLEINDNASLANVEGLHRLQAVGLPTSGALWLKDNASLTSVTGLRCLEAVGGLEIANAPITSLAGLERLSTIFATVVIEGTAITGLSGLGAFVGPTGGGQESSFFILGNSGLTSLAGLGSITAHSIWVDNNDALVDVSGLAAASYQSLTVNNNDALVSFAGLGLSTLGLDLVVEGNSNLASFAGLESLLSVGRHLRINNNASLVSLAALSSLQSCGGDLEISENESLTILGLDGLLSVTRFFVRSNLALPTCRALALLNRLVAGGFTGGSDITGNDSMATCD